MTRNPRLLVILALALVALVAVACQSAPPPAPTAAPATSKPAAPTAASAAPTAQAATEQPAEAEKKADWPEKGRSITTVVPYAPGGAADIAFRSLAPLMEKELNTPIQIVNKPGAAGMVAYTEVANAKPDGYTLAYINFASAVTNYLDPEKQATYSRQDFVPIGLQQVFPLAITVKSDSPYETVDDLVKASKENPGGIKIATAGILTTPHLAGLLLQREMGVDWASVQFNGDAESVTAVMGGHVDVACASISSMLPQYKGGAIRVLAVLEKEEFKALPGVKTMEAQGYNVSLAGAGGLAAPAGTPKDVVDVLAAAMKKGAASPEHQQKLEELGFVARYLGPEDYEKFWTEYEELLKSLMDVARSESPSK
ncbi:MAG: tripartite tricarboxylate transporter substrate binding protein [Chloroflexota bacterium]|jgi:tripartite-type tricarboxylate transporter receptor subunit TctC